MRRRARAAWSRALLAAALVTGAVAIGGCDGTTSHGGDRIAGGPLVVYTSLPTSGPGASAGRAVLDGEQIALAAVRSRIGRYRIVLRALDDANAAGSNPGLTSANAALAATDPRTIGYVGDLSSGATAVSLPLLNRADIPQISPLSTAVGLTRGGPEASPGEPEKYYPTGVPTFARVVPSDAVQSAVLATLQQQADCDRVFVLSDDEVDGRDAADSVEVADRDAGLDVVGAGQFQSTAGGVVSLPSVAARVVAPHPDCIVLSALAVAHAASVADAIVAALPRVRLFATASLATAAFVTPASGGVSRAVDPRLTITVPTLSLADYPPAARRFGARFQRRFGSGAAAGIWGDAAMSLLLDAISRASDDGRRDVTRGRVLRAIFTTRSLPSVIGTYSITARGDTTLRRFGVYRVVGGRLRFWKAMRG